MKTPTLGFAALLAALWIAAHYFGVDAKVGGHLPSAVLSCALLLGPCWAFGFGLADRLRTTNRLVHIAAPQLLLAAYLIFAMPRGDFRWDMFFGMSVVVLALSCLLINANPAGPDWHDFLVLALLGISVDLHFFDKAWPISGLNSLPKLLLVDAGLYGYLVIRPIGGIGYDFRPRLQDFRTGLREFAAFTPIALVLGFALGFVHWHNTIPTPVWLGSGWIFTLIFIALPEELFFRGLMLNLLERRIGTRRALIVSSLLFGLAHFNKRAAYFNWRYVLLATIAGVFYTRAWLAQRRVLASSITHATVDTVWSIWLR